MTEHPADRGFHRTFARTLLAVSMVVDDFSIPRSLIPCEADSPLSIHSDAVLT
jgi:hypothetical protein